MPGAEADGVRRLAGSPLLEPSTSLGSPLAARRARRMSTPAFRRPASPAADGSPFGRAHYPAQYGPASTLKFTEAGMAKLRAETLENWSREVQDLELSRGRAAALADSLEPLAAAAAAARPALPFDCEPADFVRAQRRWQEGEP